MKRVLLCCWMAVVASLGFGRVLSQEEMETFAKQFVAQDALQELFPQATVEAVAWVEVKENLGLWHIDLAPKGHLILGSSTKYRALISWAEGAFVFPEAASPQYALLLRAAERCAAAEAGEGEEHPSWTIEPTTSTRSVYPTPTTIPSTAIVHEPLDTTSWHQSTIMAWYVPGDAPCGCVATTMSQIMRVLEWPVYAEYAFEDVLPYTLSSGTISERYRFSPYSKFDYSKMTDTLSSYTAVANNHQIARLVLLNDILAEMSFTDKGSGAVNEWAASTPWTMDPNCRYLDEDSGKISYTQEDIDYIEQTMADGVPIACRVPGHSILGSGYALFNGEPYVRFNYGWGGTSNGWHHIDTADAYDITYPKRTVQCDPLPVVSSTTPTLSWHLPKCYDKKVSGFEIAATKVALTSGSPFPFSWSDDFTTLKGDVAGNTEALRNSYDYWNKDYKLEVYYPNNELTAPKILYTWQDVLIPTNATKLTFTYQQNYNRGPVVFQVLPLGGIWETVYTIDTTNTLWSSASVDLSKYAGKPCQLRLFVYPTTHSLSYTYGYVEFSLKNLEVTKLSNVIPAPKKTFTVNDATARSTTIPEGRLLPGEQWAFMVKPVFTDTTKVGTWSTPCYTEIETADEPAETFTTFEFEVASAQANALSNMRLDSTHTTRQCLYTGTSILRVKTEDNIETLEVYSSHPDAYPEEAFTVERYGDGYFDVFINGSKIPTSPRVNDRLNLTVVAVTAAGTRTAHEFSLNFTTYSNVAQSETPKEVDLPAIACSTEGKRFNIPRSWFDGYDLADRANKAEYEALLTVDSDGDGLTNAEEYLVNTNPMDKESTFKITGLTVKDGKVQVTYSPQLNDDVAKVTLQGKKTLTDDAWTTHEDTDTTHRFFRIRVEPK